MKAVKRKGRRPPPRQPTEVDVHVGGRMRQVRTMRGISQGQLADLLGLTFQQVQKYERGSNRMSASRLYQLARALDTPLAWFFQELDADRPSRARSADAELSEQETAAIMRRETLELVRVYHQIEDPKLRRKLFQVAQTLAAR